MKAGDDKLTELRRDLLIAMIASPKTDFGYDRKKLSYIACSMTDDILSVPRRKDTNP